MNRALAALIVPMFAVVACGGSVFNGGDNSADGGGGTGTDGGSGGGDGGKIKPVSGCPDAMPADGVACTPEDQHCEYGSNNGTCGNPTTDCIGGVWRQPPPTPGVACLPSDTCPSSRSAIKVGQACGQENLECNYPGQGRCTCFEQGFGGLPPYNPDGGIPPNIWTCENPQAGCPADRPRIGSACDSSGASSCFYGDCNMPDSVELQCVDGTWADEPYACAG